MRLSARLLSTLTICALASALGGAQDANAKPRHHQYRLVDLGTLGGPNSIIFGGTGPLNNAGQVTSCADTASPDAFFPNDSPYLGGDPFAQHAFLWSKGVMGDLGTLPGGGGSCGQWINDSGVVVGGSENGEFDTAAGYPRVHATRWQHGKALDLGSFGGGESIAWAINNRGQIAGDAANNIPDDYQWAFGGVGVNQVHAFLWSGGHMKDLGTLGGTDSVGFYINDVGEVAGFSSIDNVANPIGGFPTTHAFLWRNEHMIDLGSLGGSFSLPFALNNRSQVVGSSNMAGDRTGHGFLWDRGVLHDLGTLGGDNSVGNWINERGEIVGSADLTDGTHHAVIWRNKKMIDLGGVGSDPCSNGIGINSSGVAMGTSTDCFGNVLHLFLWENGEMVDLSALIRPGSNLTLNDPVMINDRGEIAGTAETPDGNVHAALLVPDGDCDGGCEERIARNAILPPSLSSQKRVAPGKTRVRPGSRFRAWQ